MRPSRFVPLLLLGLAACATPPPPTPFAANVVVPGANERVIVDQAFLVGDVSGSMKGNAKYGTEKALLQSFVGGMPAGSYQAGALGFGGFERTAVRLGPLSRSDLASWASGLPYYGDGTPLAEVLAAAGGKLAGKRGRAALVVFSDGLPNTGNGAAPDTARALATARAIEEQHGGKVCIYTVQLGDDPEGTSFMRQLAEATGCGLARNANEIDDAASLNAFQRAIFLGAAAGPVDSDGDGVVDGTDRCPRTPRGAKVDARGCWTIRGLNFDTNQAVIKPEFRPRLDEVVTVLRNNPGVRVRVDGYTDSRGSEVYNQQLSERRARAVADYFVAQGIDAGRLEVKGFGEANPVRPNDTPQNMYMNRRTELSIID